MGPQGEEGTVNLRHGFYQGGAGGESWCLKRTNGVENESRREETEEEGHLFPRA